MGLNSTFGVAGALVIARHRLVGGRVLEEVGDVGEQAAATLGASPGQTFTGVTLPNGWRGLVLDTTLTLARALGELGAVRVLGGSIAHRTPNATTFIHTPPSRSARRPPPAARP